jgi:hypothetical protein
LCWSYYYGYLLDFRFIVFELVTLICHFLLPNPSGEVPDAHHFQGEKTLTLLSGNFVGDFF